MNPSSGVPAGFVANLFDLTGLHAVVTGGGSGLGGAIAVGLAQAGARLSVLDLNQDGADKVAAEIAALGREATARRADVTSRADLAAAAEAVGPADILINSAATYARHPAEEFPEDAYDRVLAVNLKGTFLSCQIFGAAMLSRGRGSIVNIASIGASVAYPMTTAYLQSKGGVAQLTRSLALEWIGRGVRVNAIAPSLFDTPLQRTSRTTKTPTNDFILSRTPIGRYGEPREVVGPAIFLSSAAASMVTGHILQVDGGYLAT